MIILTKKEILFRAGRGAIHFPRRNGNGKCSVMDSKDMAL